METTTFWSGFVFTKGIKGISPPVETLVFTTEEDWKAFCEQYFPATAGRSTMYNTIDFSKNALIYTGSHGAKSQLGSTETFKGYRLKDGILQPVRDPEAKKFAAIVEVRQTNPAFDVWFMTWDLVEKEELPEGVKNVYKSKET